MHKIVCSPNVVKNINVKAFNLMSGTNETRRIEWHKTCECKCRFNSSIINVGLMINAGCECEELIDNGVCDK